jgi:hypothetical protein
MFIRLPDKKNRYYATCMYYKNLNAHYPTMFTITHKWRNENYMQHSICFRIFIFTRAATTHAVQTDIWVILWQLFKIPSCVYMKGKFVTNVSFATVRLINHSWDRIKYLASCFIKNIYFLRLLISWGVNICLCRHNTLNAHFLTFSST